MVRTERSAFEHGTRIELKEGEKTLSSLLVWDLRMYIGDIPVRCGGLGAVHTEREWRLRGLMRRALEESIALMQEEGYHLAALFGIPNFYTKFGFAPALVECETSIALRDAELAEAHYPVRDYEPADAPAVLALYDRLHGRRSGSVIRDSATWGGFRLGGGWSDRVGAFVVLDQTGRDVIGYAAHNLDWWNFSLSEVGYADPSVQSTILARAASMAAAMRIETMSVHTSPDDPFLDYCRKYGCETKLSYRRNSGGMARIIHQEALLQAIKPLLDARLTAAGLGDWDGALVFKTDLAETTVSFGMGGGDLAVQVPQWILAQWVLGFRDVGTSLFESDAQVDERALPILQALFPAGYPYVWMNDRF